MKKQQSLLRQQAAEIPAAERRRYRKLDDIAARIIELMGEMTQKELAKKTGKHKSYVSRVLGGGVNLTMETIADFEEVLGAEIVAVPGRYTPIRRRPAKRFSTNESFVRTSSPRPIGGVGVGDGGDLVFRTEQTQHTHTAPTAQCEYGKETQAEEDADVEETANCFG